MYAELMSLMSCVKNVYLRKLIDMYFKDNASFIKMFKNHSAAKSVHHGFIGGLLQHTLSVVRMCNYLGDHYEILDKELLMTAALFHDVGKINELAQFPASDYTDEGQLLGHIFIGAEMLRASIRTIPLFPKSLQMNLYTAFLPIMESLNSARLRNLQLPKHLRLIWRIIRMQSFRYLRKYLSRQEIRWSGSDLTEC